MDQEQKFVSPFQSWFSGISDLRLHCNSAFEVVHVAIQQIPLLDGDIGHSYRRVLLQFGNYTHVRIIQRSLHRPPLYQKTSTKDLD